MIGADVDGLLQALATNAMYSALLFAMIAPAAWLLRHRSPQLRHALWTIVLIRLVLPPSFSLPTSVWTLLSTWAEAPVLAQTMTVAAEAGQRIEHGVPGASLLLGLWLSGTALVAIAMFRSRRLLRLIVRHGHRVSDPRVLRAFERARTRIGVARRVDLVSGPAPVGAFTIGTLRPVIFVPADLVERLSDASLECVLTHELVHVRRLDDSGRVVQAVLQTVYFFNPVVWIAGMLRSRENELVCDSLAVAHGSLEPSTYGRSILDVLRAGAGPMPHAPMFLGRRNNVRHRIDSIFHARPLSRPTTAAALFLALVLLPMSIGAAGYPGDEPVKVEGDIVAPKAIEKVVPVYPPEAKEQGIEGVTVVLATIGADGKVADVEALESTRDDFAVAAMDAVRQWTFEPATLEGKPVAVQFSLTIKFRLDDKKKD
jgi:bla regulator protein BlaR1